MIIFGKEYKIVYEKDQKDKANTLYLYIENIDGVTYAKFGSLLLVISQFIDCFAQCLLGQATKMKIH